MGASSRGAPDRSSTNAFVIRHSLIPHCPRSGDGDKSPFSARLPSARQATPGRLCLHGYTGTPFEVRPIAEGLAAQGFTVSAPVLAATAAPSRTCASTGFTDWLVSAEQALQALRREVGGGPVAIAGFSLGGLLALRLAHGYPRLVAALAVMSAPLRLRPLEVAAITGLAQAAAAACARAAWACCPRRAASTCSTTRWPGATPATSRMPLDRGRSA